MNQRRKRTKTQKRSATFSYIARRAVFLITILDGLGGPKTAHVEGASGRPSLHMDKSNGYGESSNRFDKLEDGSYIAGTKQMRDRCRRYSLLRVLLVQIYLLLFNEQSKEQWENLQKRCRLNIRISNTVRERGHYDYSSPGESAPNFSIIDDISIGKRNEYYGEATLANESNRHRNYYYEVNGDALESCCPVVFEVIAPIFGRNRSGHMVELYKEEKVQQKFYEYRCHKDYLEEPCRYVDHQHRKISKCVQQYLDTYALVRSDTSLTGWSMEHIRIASGCACKVDRVKANRRRKKIFSSLNSQRSSSAGNGKRQRNLHQSQFPLDI